MPEPAFSLRGVIEGFYGTFYTFAERDDLIDFIARHGFNFYAYAPKNDRQHRMRWWEPYPENILGKFSRTIEAAHEHGVRFCYAISFGTPPNYASQEDRQVVIEKLRRFYDMGAHAFAVLLDDAPTGFANEANRRAFATVAAAHADFCNRLLDWMGSLVEPSSLMLVPTDYHGAPPFSEYLHQLGALLSPEVGICYTGTEICSPTISVDDVRAYTAAVGRKPIIWDNYPVNDLDMRSRLHLGPLRGRDPELFEVVAGFMSNPMNQPEASKIPLATIGKYLRDPCHYDAEAAWDRSIVDVVGESDAEPVRLFAGTSLQSALFPEQAPELDRLAGAALEAVERAEPRTDVGPLAALSHLLNQLDETTYYMRNRMENLALRRDLLPWLEALDCRVWGGKRAIQLLDSMSSGEDLSRGLVGLEEVLEEIKRSPKYMGGQAVVEFAERVHELGMERQRRPVPIQADVLGAGQSVMDVTQERPAS